MIIQILSNLLQEGYLRSGDYTLLSPFFAGANVAFRRNTLDQVGSYDVKCFSGEDQDICLRIARAGWDLYFQPRALVKHKNKMTLRAFVRRWFTYGLHHPYIFKKHDTSGMRIYLTGKRGKGQSIYHSLLKTRFAFNVHIFLTSFLIMNLLLLLAILLAIFNINIAAIIMGVFALAIAFYYFRGDINRRNITQTVVFIFLRYAANVALLAGGFLGGIKSGMFYVSATLDYRI